MVWNFWFIGHIGDEASTMTDILRIIKSIIGTVFVLLLVVIVIGVIGSTVSLDRTFTHTNNTNALPLFSATSSAELVRIEAGGFEFRARIAGNNPNRPTVILLHGFPVTSAMWEPLITPLAEAGYRVIAFDQRGYSPGARPTEASAYRVANLVNDVFTVADAVGAEKFHLLGHDWGAAVGWGAVSQNPDRILSWTGLSIAHPAAFADALQNDPDQQARSRYFVLFVTPFIPEILFTFNDLVALKYAYADMLFSQQEEYLSVFSEPGAMTSALNWYRQMQSGIAESQEQDPDINTPTLFIWGNNDPSAGRAAVELQETYMKGPYRLLELDADHWLVTSHSTEIIQAVLEHLQENSER
jgi:pimeloyl-ACP methyl ester carboxylesterase